MINVHLFFEVQRYCKVKQTESAASPVISNKCGDGQRSKDTACFSEFIFSEGGDKFFIFTWV